MSVTLPVDFVVTPGSLEAGVAKATEAVQAAAKAQADAQAKALAYVDGLRAKAFAADQKGREAAERAEEKQAAYLSGLKQKYFAEEQKRRDAEAAGLAKWKASLDAVALSVAGVSSEEQRLGALQEQATALFQQGKISAEAYAAAQTTIASRTQQAREATATAAEAAAALKGNLSKTGEGMAKVAAALSVVSPELAAVAGGFQKVEGLSIAAAGAAELVGASFAAISVVAVPLVAVLGGIAWAWSQHNDEVEKAKKRMEDAAAQAKETAAAMDGLRQIVSENLIKQKELSGEYTTAQAAAIRAGHSLADSYIPRLAAQAKALEAAKQSLADYNATMGQRSLLENTFHNQKATLAADVLAQQKATERLTAEYKSALTGQVENIKTEGKLKDAKEATTAATKAQAAAVKDAKDALAQYNAAILSSSTEYDMMAESQAAVARSQALLDAQTSDGMDLASAYADMMSESYLAVAKSQEEAGKAVDELAAKNKKAAEESQQAWLSALSAAQNGVAGIVGAIAGPVAGAIADMVLNLDDTFASLEEQLLSLPKIIRSIPDLVSGLVEMLPAILEGVVAAIPDLILALVAQLPSIIYGIVALIPDLIMAVVEALPDIISGLVTMIPTVAVALVGSVVTELLPALPKIALGLVEALAGALYQTVLRLAAAFLDAIGFDEKAKELRKTARTYGDTPGPVYMPHGGSADFGRGDWVAAARSRQELQRQVGGGGQSSGWSAAPVAVSYSDGHVGFDREMRRAIRQPRLYTEIFGFTAARKLA